MHKWNLAGVVSSRITNLSGEKDYSKLSVNQECLLLGLKKIIFRLNFIEQFSTLQQVLHDVYDKFKSLFYLILLY